MARTRLGLKPPGATRIASLSVARSSILSPWTHRRPLAIEIIAVPLGYGDGFVVGGAWQRGHVGTALRLHDPAFFEQLHDLVVSILDGIGRRHALSDSVAHRLLDQALRADGAE